MVLAASRPRDSGAREPTSSLTAPSLGLAELRSARTLRVGIVNIMPRAETYETYLLRPLARATLAVSPVWIRLRSHEYGSSDSEHIRRHYIPFDDAIRAEGLDGLILTGAPVEELEYCDVHYWSELSQILQFCRANVASVLGLCWGGLALAKLLGIEKRPFASKLFGVFRDRNLVPDHPILGGSDDLFWCVHSRHAGIRDEDLETARDLGIVNLLSHGPRTGYSLFESADGRYLMHLGHPEYEASRLREEWIRDSTLGRPGVGPPENFNLVRPASVWQSHCNDLFLQWLRYVAVGGPQRRAHGDRSNL